MLVLFTKKKNGCLTCLSCYHRRLRLNPDPNQSGKNKISYIKGEKVYILYLESMN